MDHTSEEPSSSEKAVDQMIVKEAVKQTPDDAGIIYLSSVPPISMNSVRRIFAQHGELGRIWLQRDYKAGGGKRRVYKEGWIEFKNKKVAKRVATILNNTSVGGKRTSRAYDCLWNIKYLHRFKWYHLMEQMAYEKAVNKHRMQAEIVQAKKQANFYAEQVEKGYRLKKLEEETLKKSNLWERYQRQVKQRKPLKKVDQTERQEILENIFR